MIDDSRHREVFSSGRFGGRRVDVIGAGATGSRIALALAKLGVQNLHVWDFDKVEAHNIANQLYPVDQVGRSKVRALYELIYSQTGDEIIEHEKRVEGGERLGQVVFLLTDTMASRKAIFEGMKYKFDTKLLIETRMGRDSGMVYAVEPFRPKQIDRYEQTLYTDDESVTEASFCGTQITVGATADLVAGFAIWQFIRWWQREQTGEGEVDFELIFGSSPSCLYAF